MSGTDKAPYARRLESLWAKVHVIYMLQYDAGMLDDDQAEAELAEIGIDRVFVTEVSV